LLHFHERKEGSMTASEGILDVKVAIVTGASAGIGRAIARLFAAEGAKLVISARGRERLDAVADEIAADGGTVVAVAGDVADEDHARALVEEAAGRFGGLDIAVNNAGAMGPTGATPEIATADWRATLATNLTGGFLAAKYQVPAMLARGTGSLIFVGSFVGHTVAMPGVAAYAASKAGLLGLMKSLAVEFGPQGLRVNALLPGGTQTAMADAFAPDDGSKAFVRNLFALKRIAEPEEQARVALFLASDAASFVTGSAMLADGGVSINRT
jgi:NAD(P)-dependent dehydrogenase (short-subunit alcohol dehydrogenase family)